jgi:hypothetical protein
MAPRLFCSASVNSLRPTARGILVGEVGSSFSSVGTLEGGFKPEGLAKVCRAGVSEGRLLHSKSVHTWFSVSIAGVVQAGVQTMMNISRACYVGATVAAETAGWLSRWRIACLGVVPT